MNSPVIHSVDAEGIGWIVFNDPELRANLLNPPTMAALRAAIDALAVSNASAVIVTSSKERIFIAGADLHWLAGLADISAGTEVSRKGQRLFEALEALPVPTICAIDGACAGGGLELALACQWRIASDAPETKIGLPETSIGLIPGWGGCVRLPRLIGVTAALDHIQKALLVSAEKALEIGIVDEVVPAADLNNRAIEAARRFGQAGSCLRLAPQAPQPGFFGEKRRGASQSPFSSQVAPMVALEVIERTSRLHVKPAYEIEAEAFGRVVASPECKERIEAFFRSK